MREGFAAQFSAKPVLEQTLFDPAPSGPARSLKRKLPPARDWLVREGVSFSAIERVLKELDQTGSAQVQASPRIGPRILRAWFDTVFNQLIQSLKFELLLIGKHNWTFSFRPVALERIRPVRWYLADKGQANLAQILQLDVVLAASLQ